jgi:hypothetical protein
LEILISLKSLSFKEIFFMGPKRKNNENGSSRIVVVLEEPVGAVKWGVTSTTDTSIDRVCFCINLNSGAPSDVPILSASI